MDRARVHSEPVHTVGDLDRVILARTRPHAPLVVRWYDEGRPTDHNVVALDIDPTGTTALVIDRGDEDPAPPPAEGPDIRVWAVLRDLDMDTPEVDLFYTEEAARDHRLALIDRGEHAQNVLVREEVIADRSWIGERQ